ncbi:MAG: acyltransferase [Verrucomicrobiales bacterium]|nr:acyltransferase [Verrucomicrobiales bacterium]
MLLDLVRAVLRCFRRLLGYYYTWIVRLQARQTGRPLKVNGRSRVTAATSIGDNAHFNGMEIHGIGNVTIGNNFHSGVECLIICSNHNYDHGSALPYDEVDIPKDVIIEDNVWLGSRVIILGGVRIGEGAIIQAGAVVVKDVPPCGIAGGIPARVFKYRDIAHYEKLRAEKRFR